MPTFEKGVTYSYGDVLMMFVCREGETSSFKASDIVSLYEDGLTVNKVLAGPDSSMKLMDSVVYEDGVLRLNEGEVVLGGELEVKRLNSIGNNMLVGYYISDREGNKAIFYREVN
ncbi:hypothetical protein HYV12_03755 [Candidatus Dojkabacteria bacterium]|nr:hypothetical protein [Candidatus Dojkabacteria bacterium]